MQKRTTCTIIYFFLPRASKTNSRFIIELNLICFRAEPDLEFEGLLKRQHTRVKYFQGSLMNAMDLERSKVTGLKNKQRSISCLLFCQFAFIHSNFAFVFSYVKKKLASVILTVDIHPLTSTTTPSYLRPNSHPFYY